MKDLLCSHHVPYFKRPNFIPCHPEMLLSRFGLLSRLLGAPVCQAASLALVLGAEQVRKGPALGRAGHPVMKTGRRRALGAQRALGAHWAAMRGRD